MNPTLAPRLPKCRVCRDVATPADVTMRLYGENLEHLPMTSAREYLQAVGIAGTPNQLRSYLWGHRAHVDKFIARGGAVAPAQISEGITRLETTGPARWVDTNQQGMDLGRAANDILFERLRSGLMADKDVVAVARIGQVAAAKRADLELKGSIKRAEAIARIASGFASTE